MWQWLVAQIILFAVQVVLRKLGFKSRRLGWLIVVAEFAIVAHIWAHNIPALLRH